MSQEMSFHLLTVQGKVKTTNIQATCELHNQTAGNQDGVAAAKHLGDLSHNVFMSLDAETNFKGDLLFLDIWNNLEGMNQFFSDPQVQGGADMMFESREAVVWNKMSGFLHFNLPTPTGQNKRIVGIVRGTVKSIEEAEAIHNAAVETYVNIERSRGIVSHAFYVRAAAPNSPEALEVLGIDVWMHAEGMMEHYMSPEFQNSGIYKMFNNRPVSSTWIHPAGTWVEW